MYIDKHLQHLNKGKKRHRSQLICPGAVTDLQRSPCTSTSPHTRLPRETGRCSAWAVGCSRTPGCARRQRQPCWSPGTADSRPSRSPPDRVHDPRSDRPESCWWATAGLAASKRRCTPGIPNENLCLETPDMGNKRDWKKRKRKQKEKVVFRSKEQLGITI